MASARRTRRRGRSPPRRSLWPICVRCWCATRAWWARGCCHPPATKRACPITSTACARCSPTSRAACRVGSLASRRPPVSCRRRKDLPEYFTQDFHYQTGAISARIRRGSTTCRSRRCSTAPPPPCGGPPYPPIAEFLAGRDQRGIELLDVACGTGRFLRQVRLAFPAIRAKGLDLSRPYLAEARRHLEGLRPVELVAGNAEQLPFADASQDVVTTIYSLPRAAGRGAPARHGRRSRAF